MLELLALIVEDAETSALEEVFRQEPKLSYSLLRLSKLSRHGTTQPNYFSFSQTINLLGRRQLQRSNYWCIADPNDGRARIPLLQKAAARGRQMELLVSHLKPLPDINDLEDAAFMVGTFSLSLMYHSICQSRGAPAIATH